MPLSSPTRRVAALGLTQIIGYGTSYYCVAQLAARAAAEFGWPTSRLMGLFSLALLVGSVVAPWAGRRMDRVGAAPVMTLGSALVGLAIAAMALAPGPWSFSAALIALQAAAPLVLYDAAFTALVQAGGPAARARIVHLTLIAGFASTLFWPLTGWLEAWLGWRGVLALYAAVNLVVALPLHALMARRRSGGDEVGMAAATPATAPTAAPAPDPKRAARLMALMSGGFALASVVLSAVLAQMVPVLEGLGLGAGAVLVSTLFGPAQVGVRFVNMALGGKRHPLTITLLAAAALPLAIAVLGLTAPALAGAVVFAVLLGFGSGLKSIVQGTLPLALFGGVGYGVRLGRMAFFRQVAGAVAPFVFAAMLEGFGAAVALTALVAVGLAAVAAFVAIGRLQPSA